MTKKETQDMLVQTIRDEFSSENITVQNIILFGSRSRGQASPESDWDFLVCTKSELTVPHKNALITKIQTVIAEKHISIDLIIRSETALRKEQNNVGVITYYALKDGIQV